MEKLKQALAEHGLQMEDAALREYLDSLDIKEAELNDAMAAQIAAELKRSKGELSKGKGKGQKGGLTKRDGNPGGLGAQPRQQHRGTPTTGLEQSAIATDEEFRALDQLVDEYVSQKAAYHGQSWVNKIRSSPDLAFQIAGEVSAQEVADVDRFRPALEQIFGSFGAHCAAP